MLQPHSNPEGSSLGCSLSLKKVAMPRAIEQLRIDLADDWRAFNDYRKKKLKGFKIGIPELDAQVLGLQGITAIQGEPGSCKSTLALQIASYNAQQGVPVLVVDRENGRHRFKLRLISQLCAVPTKAILDAGDTQLHKWYHEVAKCPMYVDSDSSAVTYEQVRDYVEQVLDAHKKPMLLVVDSLQSLPKIEADERLSLQKWLEELDKLKLDFGSNLTILLTSEKKRGAYGSASKEAGKGTNAIEYKAELLFDIREDKDSGLLFLDLVKNRDGNTFANIALKKCLASADPSSFTFKLEHAGGDFDEQF